MSLPAVLLSRVEDAGLNASAPPGQWWIDGWLVRTLPGKARRARCVNALMPGVLPLDERIAAAEAACARTGVPLIVRVTPFTQPADLPEALRARGFEAVDPTLVLVAPTLPATAPPAVPAGLRLEALDGDAYAEVVGALRDSPPEHRRSHALRLAHSPAPYRGLALRRADDGAVLACGQVATEPPFAGLYDIFTHPEARNQGLARLLCEHLLSQGASLGATIGYLQVDAANPPALAVYRRLGFVDGYGYQYLERPGP
ncbi:MAG: GNAT family N-acetyltransferase [Ideonella sp. WA131b]|nr:GNAT family N-acetyltransferase [Ideonella sp. WA131b]